MSDWLQHCYVCDAEECQAEGDEARGEHLDYDFGAPDPDYEAGNAFRGSLG